MAPRDVTHALQDILTAIRGIQTAITGKSFEDYMADWVLRHAVERGIEIISEASRAIPPDLQALHPDIPWPRVRGIGNVLRHGYHNISGPVMWGVVIDELPRLLQAVEAIQARTDQG